jgi:glycolate oxidase FAD binding subunit
MLPLDAPLEAETTLGGIVAAGPLATGLRRLAYGTIRDSLLGVQLVRADGRIIRRGGKVVKNVAGYDMARLQYGALGTLGLITQLDLKLYPQPESSGAILAGLTRWSQAGRLVDQLLASRLQPATIALLNGEAAAQLDLAAPRLDWLLVRYDGRGPAVERQLKDTRAWMDAAQAEEIFLWDEATLAAYWPRLVNLAQLARIEPEGALLRLNVLPSSLVETVEQVTVLSAEHGLSSTVLADAALGVVWLRLRADMRDFAARLPALQPQLSRRWPQTVVAACAVELKAGLNIWGSPPATLGLMQTIKRQFDPHGLLNPGRYLF